MLANAVQRVFQARYDGTALPRQSNEGFDLSNIWGKCDGRGIHRAVKRPVDRAKQPSGVAFPLRNSLVPVRIMLVGAGLSASAVKETYRW